MKIGEVSKFLNISDQMIRYYEKNGVINPKRTESGNYREYSFMDVFMLFDALKYKEWNINIKEISNMVSKDYYHVLSDKIDKYINEIDRDIFYKTILKEKLNNISKELKTAKYNINRYWVEFASPKILFFSGISHEDNYSDSKVTKKENELILSSKYISFFDVATEFNSLYNEWYYCIDKVEYLKLNLQDYCYSKEIPERYCLCTVIDMGESGKFSHELLQPLYTYIGKNGLKQNGPPFGIIIGRGVDNDSFKRLMKIYVPIKTL